ncbi:sulfurtransferase [bacterium]|nr:sulfurtransferase [bacterium]
MKKLTALGILIALVFCFQSFVFAGEGLISVSDACKLTEDESVVFVSARNAEDYGKIHIPGAVNVWHADLYKPGDVKGVLKSADEIAKILGSKGISPDKTIIVYDAEENTFSGRLYWIFDYLGVNKVKLLDGQMKMWRKKRKPVTGEVGEVAAVEFTPTVNDAIYASTDYVASKLKDANTVIVDTRSAEEYKGEKGEAARKGHLPVAINLEYKNIINEDATIKSKEELQKIFNDAGVSSNKEVILYCETSVRAGIMYMALKDLLGYSNVKVYDGAMYEWAADPNKPLE